MDGTLSKLVKLCWLIIIKAWQFIYDMLLKPYSTMDARELAAGMPIATCQLLIVSGGRAFLIITLLSLIMPNFFLPIPIQSTEEVQVYSASLPETDPRLDITQGSGLSELVLKELTSDGYCVVRRSDDENSTDVSYIGLQKPKGKTSDSLDSWSVIFVIVFKQQSQFNIIWRDWNTEVEVFSPQKNVEYSNVILKKDILKRVHWHQIGNIACSPRVAELNPVMLLCRRPNYPAAVLSVCSWMRAHWKQTLQLQDSPIKGLPNDKRFSTLVVGPLERAIQADWGGISTLSQLVILRVSSGIIQIAILSVALCVISLNLCRKEVLCDRIRDSQSDLVITGDEKNRSAARRRAREIIDANTPGASASESELLDLTALDVLQVVQVALRKESGDNSSGGSIKKLLGQLDKRGESWPSLLKRRIDNSISMRLASRRMIDWLIAALPILGFLGTVIGMSLTVGDAAAMLAEEFGRQQSELSLLTLQLAVAFDTTLYGILAMLITGFFSVSVSIDEEQSIRSLGKSIERLVEPNASKVKK